MKKYIATNVEMTKIKINQKLFRRRRFSAGVKPLLAFLLGLLLDIMVFLL